MIEINLLEKKKNLRMPVILGVDMSTVNIKAILLVIIIGQLINWLIKPDFEKEVNELTQVSNQLKEKEKKLIDEVSENENVRKKLGAFNKRFTELKLRSRQVDKIIKDKTNPGKVLERLARNIPEDLWFNYLEIKKDRTIVIRGGSSTYKSIGNFIVAANESLFFNKSLTLVDSSTLVEKDVTKAQRVEMFEIKGNITAFDPWGQ